MSPTILRLALESLIVNSFICEPKFVRWAKVHKRRRIAKKWRKRYGPIVRCPGVMFDVAPMDFFGKKTPRQFICCPCVKAVLDKEIAK